MSLIRWLALGTVSAAVIAAVVFSLGASSGDIDGASASSATAAGQSASGGVSRPAVVVPDRDPAGTTSTGTSASTNGAATTAVPATSATPSAVLGSPPTGASAAVPAQTPFAAAGVRLRIPTLEVDAAVAPLGFDGAGGVAVPNTAAGVGWYEFSARPGAAGNAVLAGHLNWRGDRGVFDRLDELSLGDLIYVDTAGGEIAYRVVESHSVTSQTPFIDILGERSGPSTLTLFTCGGTFSTAAGEYDERLVVNAVRI